MMNKPPCKRPFCISCSKPAKICLCNRIITPLMNNSIPITIFQHSRERNHPLNSTRIALLGFKNLTVIPVSDVHFQAQFFIHPLNSDSETAIDETVARRSFDDCFRHGNCSENPDLDQISASMAEKIADLELELDTKTTTSATIIVNGFGKFCPQNCSEKSNFDRISVLESEPKTTTTATISVNSFKYHLTHLQSPRDRSEKPDVDQISGSMTANAASPILELDPKTTTIATITKNGSRSPLTNFQDHQDHPAKLCFDRISALDAANSADLALELDPRGTNTAIMTENGFRSPLTHLQSPLPEESYFDRIQASPSVQVPKLKSDCETAIKGKFDFNSSCTPLETTCISQDKPNFEQIPAFPAAKEPVSTVKPDPVIGITATIAKCGSTCPLIHLKINQKDQIEPDFGQILASPTARQVTANGFYVKKLQQKQLGGSMEFEEFVEFEVAIPPGSVLLFPSEKSTGFDAIDFSVKHLVVLDGTWAKAKTMYRENPWLELLPHLKLNSRQMSLYSEVRHQPKGGCLSTIESIVYALKALGDENVGLDNLLAVFESMVRDQRRCKDERLSTMSRL